MATRVVVGAGIIVIVGLVVYLGGWYLTGFIFAASILAQYEMMYVLNIHGAKIFASVNFAAGALVLPAMYFYGARGLMAVFALYMTAVCILAVLRNGAGIEALMKTMLAFFYPGVFFIFLMGISLSDPMKARFLIIVTVVAAAVTDTFALFSGKLFGRHPLCPEISPKKTVEGAVGGFVLGTAATVAVCVLTQGYFGVDYPFLKYALSACVLCVVSQFGDLVASLIKRGCGIKDFGNLFPGHGGLMDRADSVVFIAPLVYCFFM